MYATVGPAIMICQLLAVLEIIHPLLGWVRTGIIMPIMQVSVNIDIVILLYWLAIFPVSLIGNIDNPFLPNSALFCPNGSKIQYRY